MGRIAAGMVVLVGGLLVAPALASAADAVEAVAGVDGFVAAGKPIPVRVTVHADHLIKGTVHVISNSFGDGGTESVVPIEVAGGATRTVVVVVPGLMQPGGGGPPIQVKVVPGDATQTTTVNATVRADQELVGVFPALLAQGKPPETIKLVVDAGTARPSAFDPTDLDVPGAIDVWDMLAATNADLVALSSTAQMELRGWIARGGRLLVGANRDAAIPGLPTEWQPKDGMRVAAGRGEVEVLPEMTSWWLNLAPTPTRSQVEDQALGMQDLGGVPIANTLAADAGFKAAQVGWLIGFLSLYVFLVGPVVYIVLKRMKRPGLLWSVVPAVAVLFTGIASIIGRNQQHIGRSGYANLIESTPGGSWAFASVGSIAKGGDVTTTLPQGWRSATAGSPFFGMSGNTGRVTATLSKNQTKLSISTGVGQFEALHGFGPVTRPSSYELTATSPDDDTVTGTVRNTSGEALTDLAIFSGYGAIKLGDLAVDEAKSFTVVGVSTPTGIGRFDARTDVWPSINNVDGRQLALDGPANVALWSQFLTDAGNNVFRRGRVLAAAWTRQDPALLKVNGDMTGRTALVQEAPVRVGTRVTAATVRADILRAPGMFADGQSVVVSALTLPTLDQSVRLLVKSHSGSQVLDIWTGSDWRPFTLDETGIPLAADMVHDGRVFIRMNFAQLNGPFGNQFQGINISEATP